MWRHKKTLPATDPGDSVARPRFASQDFIWHYRINKVAPYYHNPVANLGVDQGSGPMLFYVGSMGLVSDNQDLVTANNLGLATGAENNMLGATQGN